MQSGSHDPHSISNNNNFRNNPRGGTQERKQMYCDYCKMAGHTVQKCYKIHGYPPEHKFSKGRKIAAAVQSLDTTVGHGSNPNYEGFNTQANAVPAIQTLTPEQYNQLLHILSKHSTEQEMAPNESNTTASFLAGKSFCFFTTISSDTWILDSGASDCITHDLTLLHDIKPLQQTCYITMPNGKKAQVLHIGSMYLGSDLILKEVLHTPEFQFNLLSISKLTRQFSANVIFTPECCFLQDPTM